MWPAENIMQSMWSALLCRFPTPVQRFRYIHTTAGKTNNKKVGQRTFYLVFCKKNDSCYYDINSIANTSIVVKASYLKTNQLIRYEIWRADVSLYV